MAPNGEILPSDGPKRPSGQTIGPRDGPKGFQDCPEGPNNGLGVGQWAATITPLEAKTTWASGAASQAKLFLSKGPRGHGRCQTRPGNSTPATGIAEHRIRNVVGPPNHFR